MASLPYVTAPGNIEKALNGIKSAATPERVTQDFVKTILKIPGGSGSQITSFLKKLGFANADSTPSALYKKFRNPATSGIAAAEALKNAYGPLYVRNEYMHELPDNQLRGLIIEETGQSHDSNSVALIFSAIKAIKRIADFSKQTEETEADIQANQSSPVPAVSFEQHASNLKVQDLGFNLSYTINLNLPATSDIAVFNAIFKSLKENLLRGNDHE